MTRRRHDDPRSQFSEGLDRLEKLTRDFQRELGKLQQVAEMGVLDDVSDDEEQRDADAG